MLFRETVYCDNHLEHTNALCELNAGFLMFKQLVHIVTINSTHDSMICHPEHEAGYIIS